MIEIFDSHTHYDDEVFDSDREEVLKTIKEGGVIGVLNCGSDLKGARDSFTLAKEHDFIYAAVGIHPINADEFNDSVEAEFEELAKNPKVKAIGEIGLDYYYEDNPSREVQQAVFRRQMALAEKLDLPVIIHDRDAHHDTLEIIKEFPKVTGVVHCFSGSVEFARQCVKEGYYIGVTGVITFKNSKKLAEVVKDLPLEKLLVETDCPYMAPTPFRGTRNQSDYILKIMESMAEIKNTTVEEISNITIKNTKNLLKIKY